MKFQYSASDAHRGNASETETDTGHNGGMKKVVVYIPQSRRVVRATQMRALLQHARPHGGNVAERVKQGRQKDRSA
jgi:hypothetical protein